MTVPVTCYLLAVWLVHVPRQAARAHAQLRVPRRRGAAPARLQLAARAGARHRVVLTPCSSRSSSPRERRPAAADALPDAAARRRGTRFRARFPRSGHHRGMQTRRLRSALLACALLATVLALAACGQSGPADDVNVGTGAHRRQLPGLRQQRGRDAGLRGHDRWRADRGRDDRHATASEGTTTAEGTTTGEAHHDARARRPRRPRPARRPARHDRRRHGRRGGRQGRLHERRLRRLPHAGRRRRDRQRRPEPRRPEARRPDRGRPRSPRAAAACRRSPASCPSSRSRTSRPTSRRRRAATPARGAPATTSSEATSSEDDATDDHGGDDDNSGPGGGDDDNSGPGGGATTRPRGVRQRRCPGAERPWARRRGKRSTPSVRAMTARSRPSALAR